MIGNYPLVFPGVKYVCNYAGLDERAKRFGLPSADSDSRMESDRKTDGDGWSQPANVPRYCSSW